MDVDNPPPYISTRNFLRASSTASPASSAALKSLRSLQKNRPYTGENLLRRLNEVNGRLAPRQFVQGTVDRLECCHLTGDPAYEHAHVFPHSVQLVPKLDQWLREVGALSWDNKVAIKAKSEPKNIVWLECGLAKRLEVKSHRPLVLCPTRDTLLALIDRAERFLQACEADLETPFLGTSCLDFFADWQPQIDAGGAVAKTYQYEIWFFDLAFSPAFVQIHRQAGLQTHQIHETDMDEEDAQPWPFQFDPALEPVTLCVCPVLAVLTARETLRRFLKRNRFAQPDGSRPPLLRQESWETLCELGEYFLQLCEVDYPSAFRELVRPAMLPELAAEPLERNTRARFESAPMTAIPPPLPPVAISAQNALQGSSSSSAPDPGVGRSAPLPIDKPVLLDFYPYNVEDDFEDDDDSKYGDDDDDKSEVGTLAESFDSGLHFSDLHSPVETLALSDSWKDDGLASLASSATSAAEQAPVSSQSSSEAWRSESAEKGRRGVLQAAAILGTHSRALRALRTDPLVVSSSP